MGPWRELCQMLRASGQGVWEPLPCGIGGGSWHRSTSTLFEATTRLPVLVSPVALSASFTECLGPCRAAYSRLLSAPPPGHPRLMPGSAYSHPQGFVWCSEPPFPGDFLGFSPGPFSLIPGDPSRTLLKVEVSRESSWLLWRPPVLAPCWPLLPLILSSRAGVQAARAEPTVRS